MWAAIALALVVGLGIWGDRRARELEPPNIEQCLMEQDVSPTPDHASCLAPHERENLQ